MEYCPQATLQELQDRIRSGNLPKAEQARAEKLQKAQFPRGIPAGGADALRLTLVSSTSNARDINFDGNRVESHGAFLNKIWNAVKFSIAATTTNYPTSDTDHPTSDTGSAQSTTGDSDGTLPVEVRWIRSRLAHSVLEANRALGDFDFPGYTQRLYTFWVNEYCDVFIELVKTEVKEASASDSPSDASRIPAFGKALIECAEAGLRLLGPGAYYQYVHEIFCCSSLPILVHIQ
eukprot:m.742162 g.742162  ORF g.742162 m.742162 type:complete len:234 (+) comp23117_c0_seq13:2436-3137(+)